MREERNEKRKVMREEKLQKYFATDAEMNEF